MNVSDFLDTTPTQKLRDGWFIDYFTNEIRPQLLEELNDAIPGYANMGDKDKYLALLRLNEEHAPHGAWILADFGYLGDLNDDGDKMLRETGCAFYRGGSEAYTFTELGGVRRYIPLYKHTDTVGIDSNEAILTDYMLWLNPPNNAESETDKMPICFKGAFFAEMVRQNLTVSRVAACRFIFGMTDELHIERVRIRAIEDGRFQRFGWTITIRDTMPSNEMADALAAWMRAAVRREMEDGSARTYDFEGGTTAPLFAEGEPKRRRGQERTNTLLYFIDKYLPSKGYHLAGKRKEPGYLSWEDAWEMFGEMYPKFAYSWVDTFKSSYTQAKARRKAAGNGNRS